MDRDARVAEALFRRAIANGGHFDLYTTLAEVTGARGDVVASGAYREQFREVAMSGPNETRLYRRPLSLMLAEDERTLPEALKLAQEDYRARPDQGSLAVLAFVLQRSGQSADALDAAHRAVAWGAPEPTTLYLAGEAALGAGDVGFATQLLEGALAAEIELGPAAAGRIREMLGRAG